MWVPRTQRMVICHLLARGTGNPLLPLNAASVCGLGRSYAAQHRVWTEFARQRRYDLTSASRHSMTCCSCPRVLRAHCPLAWPLQACIAEFLSFACTLLLCARTSPYGRMRCCFLSFFLAYASLPGRWLYTTFSITAMIRSERGGGCSSIEYRAGIPRGTEHNNKTSSEGCRRVF